MAPLSSEGQTANRGCEPPQFCQPQHDRQWRNSEKSARAATIFIHNGAPQAVLVAKADLEPAAGNIPEGRVSRAIRNPKGMRRSIGL